MKSPRSDEQRLQDILDAIEAIQRHGWTDHELFLRDEVLRWFFRAQVQIVGEAIYKLSESFRKTHPHVPWRAVIGMRHILVHDYFDVEWEILWRVLQTRIQPLKADIEAILRDLQNHETAGD
jgi:uncharacterized protein with HEPN domain